MENNVKLIWENDATMLYALNLTFHYKKLEKYEIYNPLASFMKANVRAYLNSHANSLVN